MPLGAARAGFTLAGGAKDMEMTIYMAAGGGGGGLGTGHSGWGYFRGAGGGGGGYITGSDYELFDTATNYAVSIGGGGGGQSTGTDTTVVYKGGTLTLSLIHI